MIGQLDAAFSIENLPAFEADQVICLYGLPDRDGRLALRRRNRLPGLHQCLMDIVDKFREVRRGYGVVADMRAYDLGRQPAHYVSSAISVGPSPINSAGLLKARQFCLLIIVR